MAQYVAFHPEVQVCGQATLGFLEGAGRFAPMVQKLLTKHGITQVKLTDWYPQQKWLDALREIASVIGENALFSIGKQIPELAVWPPGIDSMEKGFAVFDIAYHLNHRINGELLFNAATGEIKAGIGNFVCRPGGPTHLTMLCHNPYPSEFDRGIITGLARKFQPGVEVTLDETQPTRKRGGDSCTYVVRW